jgi:RNA polymerase sigma factor (sigma-70 family)
VLTQWETVSSAELVERARDGDADAWTALTDRHSDMMWAIARSRGLPQADAADVVQTVWLRLVERLDALRDPRRVGAWLAVTTTREADRVRFQSVRWPGGHTPPTAAVEPERVCTARDRLSRVMAALEELPDRCQRLLRLFAVSPTYGDVAAALGIPIGSVGPTRARCLSALRQHLGDDF